MRFVVDFAHGKSWGLVERLRGGDAGSELPLGTYRHINVVVEATDHEDALQKAKAALGWPDDEGRPPPHERLVPGGHRAHAVGRAPRARARVTRRKAKPKRPRAGCARA